MKKKIAFTKSGAKVLLNDLREVDGGWEGYTRHSNGYAVLVFIPAK